MRLPRSLFNMVITVFRTSAGSYDAYDRWIEGVETPITHNFTSVQPASGEDIALLPEGERSDDMVIIYDAEALYVTDKIAGTVADVILYDNKRYKVIRCKPWKTGILDHYEAIADRERE